MSEAPADLLEALYARGEAVGSDGRPVALHSAIPRSFGAALTRIVRDNGARTVIEIGMAFGASSLAILAGLPDDGRLISIDPFQDDYGRAGRLLVERSTRAAAHTLIEAPDYLALPRLLEQGVVADLVYIDGMHTFDYVALDAFYAGKLLKVGGIMAFNDCGFRSIHKFLRYFRRHRHYAEIDAGLSADHRGGNPLVTLVRRIEGRSNQDRYFRKLDDWEPGHNFFRRF